LFPLKVSARSGRIVARGQVEARSRGLMNPVAASNSYDIPFTLSMPMRWNGRLLSEGDGDADGKLPAPHRLIANRARTENGPAGFTTVITEDKS
jgi:hypothetical protein